MGMKVFYSWQLDSPPKENKSFIEECLKSAISQIADDISVEFAERTEQADTNVAIELEKDTDGVLGTPEIFSTIVDRIKTCDVFVADVTLTGKSKDEKSNKAYPDPNVLVEVGFALANDSKKIVLVMNENYGGLDAMPFDFRNRRGPTRFTPDKKNDFVGKLKSILRQYHDNYRQVTKPVLELSWKLIEQGPNDYGLQFGLYNSGDQQIKNVAIKFISSDSFDAHKLRLTDRERYGTPTWDFDRHEDHMLVKFQHDRPVQSKSHEWACNYNGVVHSIRTQLKFQNMSFSYEVKGPEPLGSVSRICSITRSDVEAQIAKLKK